MTKQPIDRLAKAIEIVNAGSAIKSKIKEALDDLNSAYAAKKKIIQDACLTQFQAFHEAGMSHEEINKTAFEAVYWGVPDLHVFKAKHAELIRSAFPTSLDEVIAQIEELVELRAAVKSVEVIVKAPKEISVEEKVKQRVMKSFNELAKERRAQFEWAKEIIIELNKELPEIKKMPVSVNHVYCENQWGTQWLRIDWYFRGYKTAFNVIAAAAQAAADEKEGK